MEVIIYIAALTYRRPDLLRGLVANFLNVKSPDGFDVRFLIVDNDPQESAREFIEGVIPQFYGRLSYFVEPTPGIPAARNRAIDEVTSAGATLLCFLDDDEFPDVDWLEQLIEHWKTTGAALIGGPVLRTLPEQCGSLFKRMFGHSLIARRRVAIARDVKAVMKGLPVPVYTSNWMCDLSQVTQWGLRFDDKMQFSGGSDAAFWMAVRSVGLRTSWCPDAKVSEPIELDRLTVRYQFGRSRSQGIVRAALSKKPALRIGIEQVPRAFAGAILIMLPFIHPAAFAAGLDLIGSAVGHFAFLKGRSSALYERKETT